MRTIVYAAGPCSLSACALKTASVEDVALDVNKQHPTGISSDWKLSEDPTFAGGEPMPCQCEADPDRLHYLFHC